MKRNSTQQEILLLTGTHFTSRQWSTKDDIVSDNLSEEEKLEEACWNGLLPEMLPELYRQPIGTKQLFVWQIKEGASFLELELGEVVCPRSGRPSTQRAWAQRSMAAMGVSLGPNRR